MSLQIRIAELLLKQVEESGFAGAVMVQGKDPMEICSLIFSNFRGSTRSNSKGMRLSDLGHSLMKSLFKSYSIDLAPGYRLRSPHIIYLDRVSFMPYWVSDKHITLFDAELAMMLRLSDCDIGTLMDSRFRLDPGSKGIKVRL